MKNLVLTYKIKFILLLILSAILGYLCYTKKIKSTVKRIERINELNNLTENNDNIINEDIDLLLKQKEELEKSISFGRSSSFVSYLIEEITNHNKSINIINVSDLFVVEDLGCHISSLYITVENDYKSIVKLVNFIENEINSINIISVHYYSKKINYNSSKKSLYATIYLQNVKNG